jgi:hypothetical protein
LLPTEGFKYPINKIVKKEVPIKERRPYWQDMNTNKKYFDVQYQRIPLNSDAYLDICNTRDKK